MSKQEFLDNFRIARRLFAHPRVQTDTPNLGPQDLEKVIARAAIWLTPKSVKGFNVDDFSELGPDRRRELETAVSEFLQIASQVPPTAQPSRRQIEAAAAAFAKIIPIAELYVSTSNEGAMVEKVLENVAFPESVANWEYELDNDSDGMPAVWINLYVDETCVPRRELGRLASRMSTEILQALSAAGSNLWPYVRVRTAVEHKTA